MEQCQPGFSINLAANAALYVTLMKKQSPEKVHQQILLSFTVIIHFFEQGKSGPEPGWADLTLFIRKAC